ncbi:ABC transporter substrate-binding protein [Actinocrinis sp.]|uniref:ABC transporter substrate-binding protein n=1 Tax=Actinocrinis sp. TaxID=1920516 RepID=UPI002D3F6195|nr:ABC transporter substrate-binding protein [Actinocrinis sp.]HZP51259.1 ABC transporter substrate-binding protein [Actinocrinis sp.]
MFHRKLALAIAALTAAAGISSCSSSNSGSSASAGGGSSAAPITVKIAVANQTNQSYIPLILAQQLGFFRKQGLNVQIVSVTSGAQTFSLLLSKQVQGVVGFYDHDQDLVAKGTQVHEVVQLLQAPGMVELVRDDESAAITSPADLAGKNVGITGLGGSTEFLADYLAAHSGAGVSSIHPVSVAAGATFVAAMQHKSIDAGVTTEPTISSLLSKHLAKILVDMRSVAGTQAALGGPYPGTALSVTAAWESANAATVQKLVNALVESLHYIQQHSAQQIADAMPASYYASTGKTAYVQALANEIGMYNPTGLMPTDGPQSVFRVLSEFDPAVKGHQIDLSQTYTDQYVQKVPAS